MIISFSRKFLRLLEKIESKYAAYLVGFLAFGYNEVYVLLIRVIKSNILGSYAIFHKIHFKMSEIRFQGLITSLIVPFHSAFTSKFAHVKIGSFISNYYFVKQQRSNLLSTYGLFSTFPPMIINFELY